MLKQLIVKLVHYYISMKKSKIHKTLSQYNCSNKIIVILL